MLGCVVVGDVGVLVFAGCCGVLVCACRCGVSVVGADADPGLSVLLFGFCLFSKTLLAFSVMRSVVWIMD